MDRKRMVELLVSEGLLTDDQVRVAVQAHTSMGKGSRFGEYLVELGLLTPRNLAYILGRQFHLDVVQIDDLQPDAEALMAVGRPMAERLGVLPLSVMDGQLTVAVSDPLDFGVPKALASESRLRVRIVLASAEEISQGINRWYAEAGVAPEGDGGDVGRSPKPQLTPMGGTGELLAQLIRAARDARSTELIVTPAHGGVKVQARNAAGLRELMHLEAGRGASLMAELRTRAGLTPGPTLVPREGRGSVTVGGVAMQVELALLPTLAGERAMLSLQTHGDRPLTLEALPMSRTNQEIVDQLLAAPGGGVILLMGLPGEDLRTLLVGIAQRMSPSEHVIAIIEDGKAPLIDNVIQVARRPGRRGMSHADALGAVLRQEPQGVLICDLRDSDTAAMAFEAALSGVMVVCGMHASGPAQALQRLSEMGVEGVALARALTAVGVQRWGQRICGACRQPQPAAASELKALELEDFAGQFELYQGRGCSACDGVGLVEAVGIQGLVSVTEDDQHHLLRNEQPWDLFTRLQEALIYDAAAKAIGGYVTGRAATQIVGSL